jgi:hypothetical protein
MNPNLLPVVAAQLMQQNQLIRAQASRLLQEEEAERRQAELLEERARQLASARQAADTLVHEASTHPQRTFVKLQIMLSNLDYCGAVPDSYAEQQEREQVVLLWRRLLNTVDKSQSLMTDAQMAECRACLDAFSTEYWVRETARRLEAYELYQQVKPLREEAHRQVRQIVLRRRWLWAGIALLALAGYLLFARRVGADQASGYLVWWVLAIVVLAGVVFYVGERRMPRDRDALDHQYQLAYQEGEIANTDFWSFVAEKFGGVPTMERLNQAWAEQEAVINALFAERAAEAQTENGKS